MDISRYKNLTHHIDYQRNDLVELICPQLLVSVIRLAALLDLLQHALDQEPLKNLQF